MKFEIFGFEVVTSLTHSQSRDWLQDSQFIGRPYFQNGLSDLHEIFTKHIGLWTSFIISVQ